MTTIEEGTLLRITHTRKGEFVAVATRTFDTGETWWPVAVAEGRVHGASREHNLAGGWRTGDKIPCRGDLVKGFKPINEMPDRAPQFQTVDECRMGRPHFYTLSKQADAPFVCEDCGKLLSLEDALPMVNWGNHWRYSMQKRSDDAGS